MMLVLHTAQYKAHTEKYVVKYTLYSFFPKVNNSVAECIEEKGYTGSMV